jgi:hypothetical protein
MEPKAAREQSSEFLDPRFHNAVDELLCGVRWNSEHGDLISLRHNVFFEIGLGPYCDVSPAGSDFCRIAVVNSAYDKSSFRKARISREGGSDLSCSDDADTPLLLETEYLPET